MVYADHAATTKIDPEAFDAMKPYLLEDYSNPSQPYFFAKSAKKAIADARETIASCIGAESDEIFFTSGGTESDNWAIKSVLFTKKKTKRVITSMIEHHAVLNACKSLQELGIPVSYLPADKNGIIHPDILKKRIKDNDALVSVMAANNEIGTIEPIQELCAIAHEKGVLFHTDAVQAIGHIPINVKELGIDMLSASAHKFNGMKGSGFLYICKSVDIHSYLDGGAQEKGLRAGTENVAGIVAMATALKNNCDHLKKNTTKLNKLERVFINALSQTGINFIRNGSDSHLPGYINISIKNSDGEMLLHRLDLMGICVSTGSACDSINTKISHVINAINVPSSYAPGTIRITFGSENTEEDALRISNALKKILG